MTLTSWTQGHKPVQILKYTICQKFVTILNASFMSESSEMEWLLHDCRYALSSSSHSRTQTGNPTLFVRPSGPVITIMLRHYVQTLKACCINKIGRAHHVLMLHTLQWNDGSTPAIVMCVVTKQGGGAASII